MLRTRQQRLLEQRKAKLVPRLPDPLETVRGTLVERYLTCGNANCRCHAKGPRHGPYYYLLTSTGPGKTRTTLVPNDQLVRVRRWIANFKRFKDVSEKITELNTELVRASRMDKGRSKRAGRSGR
jgi:hypothetical protein